jgi:predicted aspartyl protease
VNVTAPEPPPADPDTQARLDIGADASKRITAPVHINGQGPFDFVVDTGANRTVVSVELAAALSLPDGGPSNVHGVAGVEVAPTAIINLLEADAIAVRGLRAPALARDRLGADGLLGVDVLHDRRVVINFVQRKLTISADRSITRDLSGFDLRRSATGNHEDLGFRVAVPARYRFGQLIIIGADVRGRGVTAFVDSGSQCTVGNNALRRLALDSGPADTTAARYLVPVLSATGQTAQGELGRVPLLRIGGMDIVGLSTVFADLHVFEIWDLMKRPSLLIGMDILSRFNAIELNYAKREVVFYLPAKGRTG